MHTNTVTFTPQSLFIIVHSTLGLEFPKGFPPPLYKRLQIKWALEIQTNGHELLMAISVRQPLQNLLFRPFVRLQDKIPSHPAPYTHSLSPIEPHSNFFVSNWIAPWPGPGAWYRIWGCLEYFGVPVLLVYGALTANPGHLVRLTFLKIGSTTFLKYFSRRMRV
jgi:hypothetical protein